MFIKLTNIFPSQKRGTLWIDSDSVTSVLEDENNCTLVHAIDGAVYKVEEPAKAVVTEICGNDLPEYDESHNEFGVNFNY